MRLMRFLFNLCLLILCVGCQQGAVVFAPTPLPPDFSPVRYQHPGGVFTVDAPRNWSVHSHSTSLLAAAHFTSPGGYEPIIGFTVINWQDTTGSLTLNDVINAYQSEIRPDIQRYTEQERQVLGDGSWRLTGVRSHLDGTLQEINTFIEQHQSLIGITEVSLPQDAQLRRQLEAVINTFHINDQANLQPASLSTLASVPQTDLALTHVKTWGTPQGVYFVTGEIVNYGFQTVGEIPVRAELQTAEGVGVAEAIDMVMGYGIPPGGFAPFSLRFGQQPAGTTRYALTIGNANWRPQNNIIENLYSADAMTWTSQTSISSEGVLSVSGVVTNTSSQTLYNPLATITIFDAQENVIAAGFTSIKEGEFAPGESLEFHFRVQEYGGEPANHYVNIQALSGE